MKRTFLVYFLTYLSIFLGLMITSSGQSFGEEQDYIQDVSSFELTVVDEQVMINWMLEPDQTINNLQIEHSTDGLVYGGIARYPDSLQTSEVAFEFLDEYPADGTNYYRVRYQDEMGKVHVYGTLDIEIKKRKKLRIKKFAEYVHSLELQIENPTQEEFFLELINPDGHVITQQTAGAGRTLVSLSLPLGSVSAGLYRVSIRNAGGILASTDFFK